MARLSAFATTSNSTNVGNKCRALVARARISVRLSPAGAIQVEAHEQEDSNTTSS
ncbi:unnamed protein product [Amoebophrya sp. A120]|nr:unnamed protein product [Amoebophrya sp. A120]|eukprot:GSA120T00014437001.1